MFNQKLDSILSNYSSKKSEIQKKYADYNDKVKSEKENRDKGFLLSGTKKELESLKSEIDIKLNTIQSEIKDKTKSGIDNPDIEKLVASQEYNSALMILMKKPTDIDRILKQAYDDNRLLFADAISKEVLGSNEYSEGIKYSVRYRMNEFEERTGLKSLKDERLSLRYITSQIDEHISRAESNPSEFEKKIDIYSKGMEAYNKAESINKL